MDPIIERLIAANRQAAGAFMRLADGRGMGAFFGPRMAGARAEVLSALWGKPVSKSRATWGVFTREVEDAFGARGSCIAARRADCEARIAACGAVPSEGGDR